jgi:hypothetical protein
MSNLFRSGKQEEVSSAQAVMLRRNGVRYRFLWKRYLTPFLPFLEGGAYTGLHACSTDQRLVGRRVKWKSMMRRA